MPLLEASVDPIDEVSALGEHEFEHAEADPLDSERRNPVV